MFSLSPQMITEQLQQNSTATAANLQASCDAEACADLNAHRGRTIGSASVSGRALAYQHPPGVNTVHCTAAAHGSVVDAASSSSHAASTATAGLL